MTLLLLLLIVAFSFSETIRVASASSFRFALNPIIKEFEKRTGNRVLVSYGASGHFFIQIKNGAPYDIFISANEIYPKKLIESKKAVKASYTIFARGKLTLFTMKNIELKDYKVLLSPRVKTVAIANPKHAPYGRAAMEFLKNTGLYKKVLKKLVYGSNVSQAFQYVVSKGADIGIVALSLVIPYGKGNYLVIDPKLYSPINNVAVITEHGKDKKVSWEFIKFLSSPFAKEVLRKYGYEVP
ncbi:molybdate ABC transporter substrate-binding protein [Aquifex aeolicus]|uniref:Molybdate periplasmic binding protein n=1 Tax=Aquifex aeolicus (strain VF5) TaxID=224324 RepID=O67540_AQUAE|nr:molybdate ABC transporter substrate-binding protein [Aquifex aeolicus]AAC07501.1 molybdate periplasmic binding protein [Aquifex aeolicus VF5]